LPLARALTAWPATAPGLAGNPQVVWGGTPPGQQQPVVVLAAPAPGGGRAVLALTGDGEGPNLATGPDSTHLVGPPPAEVDTSITTGTGSSTGLLAVRLPTASGAQGDNVLVIAPDGAAKVGVNGADPVALVNGAQVLHVRWPADATIRAYDPQDRVLGELRVQDQLGDQLYGMRLVEQW